MCMKVCVYVWSCQRLRNWGALYSQTYACTDRKREGTRCFRRDGKEKNTCVCAVCAHARRRVFCAQPVFCIVGRAAEARREMQKVQTGGSDGTSQRKCRLVKRWYKPKSATKRTQATKRYRHSDISKTQSAWSTLSRRKLDFTLKTDERQSKCKLQKYNSMTLVCFGWLGCSGQSPASRVISQILLEHRKVMRTLHSAAVRAIFIRIREREHARHQHVRHQMCGEH